MEESLRGPGYPSLWTEGSSRRAPAAKSADEAAIEKAVKASQKWFRSPNVTKSVDFRHADKIGAIL